MIPRECRRLAEVDFPIAVVSRHAAREKSIRHGHPSTLHLWWARRPLASSRAVLLALLLPDPGDPACPAAFRARAPEILSAVRQPPADAAELRRALLWFIGSFADWNMAADRTYLRVARELVRAAHADEAPLVVDPFAGGGSIPLEALRLGCEAFASDLNPVACLILKVMLEEIPRRGPGLADELRRVGGEIKAAAEKELAGLYPPDPDGATPIAYLWARTVRCEAPRCGAEIPLLRSFWLCKKAKRKRALRLRVVRPRNEPPRVDFEIFEPGAERDVPAGTVTRAKAACPCCHVVLPPERVRAQLAAQRGGADAVFDDAGRRVGGARLTAVVTLRPGETGRHYRLPTDADYATVRAAQARLAGMLDEWERGGKQGLCPVPDESISLNEIRRISVPIYGMTTWGDLFTARQKAGLVELGRLVASKNRDDELKSATDPLLGISVNKTADLGNALAPWKPDAECPVHLFARQAIGMAWDFCESVPPCESSGSFLSSYQRSADALESIGDIGPISGQVQSADSTTHLLPDQAAGVWFTDPPYYDAVPYAHLSDFFFVWLKRAVPDQLNFADRVGLHALTPKEKEIVVDRPHRLSTSTKTAVTYESGMAAAFAEGHRVLHPDGIGSVVFAHKTTEGWEALLSGMISGGWTITGSWPVATEMGSRLNARETASLATSVHLVCRPRPADAPVGDWADVLRELPPRVGEWMERLQGEGVRGADLVFACIGPALEIFSRHPSVETPDGREVGLAEYLERVWEVVGRTALENILGAAEARARNGLAGALEEDARLTALFLWTLQATDADAGAEDGGAGDDADADDGDSDDAPGGKVAGFALVFDVVRRFAQPLGIDLPKWEKRTIETKKGVVRLLSVHDRAHYLFGEGGGAQAVAAWIERAAGGPGPLQGMLFPDRPESAAAAVHEPRPLYGDDAGGEPRPRTGGDAVGEPRPRYGEAAVGEPRSRTGAVAVGEPRYGAADDPAADRSAAPAGDTTLDRVHRAMLFQAGGQTGALNALLKSERERGPDFLRLSNALSALYPRGSEEKRLLDAMLLAAPR